MKNNFDSFKIWNNFGKKLGGGIQSFSKYSAQGISRNTIGYAANKLANNDSLKNMASRSVLAGMALKGLRNTAKPYAENRDKAVQERTKFAESLGGDMSKVRFHEEEIRDLRQQQQQYYDNGQFDDAKALDKKIQEIRKLRDTAKLEAVRERKEAYARRQSIWLKLNGANAEAASKIQNEVISKRLEEANKDLDKIKSDAKEKRNILDKLVTSQEAQIARGGNLSDDQKARKAKLEDEIKVIEEKLKGANAKVLDLEDQLSKV
jgi:chromosome segregation ATPase